VPALAQAQFEASTESNPASAYRESVVSRTTRAVKYEHRSGAEEIEMEFKDRPSAFGGWQPFVLFTGSMTLW